MRRQSAFTRHVLGLEQKARSEARATMARYAPDPELARLAREFSLIPGAGGLGLNHYMQAGMAGAVTLWVYVNEIEHVEGGVTS